MRWLGRRSFLRAAGATGLTAGLSCAPLSWAGQAQGALPSFEAAFGGIVHRPGSTDYERLATAYQARATARPALFAHCRSIEEVSRGVLAARDAGASLAVRGGGHSYAGHSIGEDGCVVLDLSGLRSVELSADAASVTVGGGALMGMIDAETGRAGRAMTLGQCPTVGVGGFALGGGVGPLMSRQGAGCDHLLSAEVVMADGRVVTASADEDADLYWAIRGGGGNFGVAASLTFRVEPVADVLGGFVTLRSDDPAEALRLFADTCETASDALGLIAMATPGPGGHPLLIIQVCHSGSPAEAERETASLLGSSLVVDNQVRRLPYAELQTQGPSEIPVVPSVSKGGFSARFDHTAAEQVSQALLAATGPYMVGLVPLHGAITRVGVTDTAFPLREPGMGFDVTRFLTSLDEVEQAEAWGDALAAEVFDPDGRAYVNVMDEDGPAAVRAAYGGNFPRLAELKQRFDPDNVFRFNQNIAP